MTAALLLALACGARPPSEATPPPTPTGEPAPAAPAPTTPAPTAPTTPTTLLGKWTSPACGERTYPRELTLAADGTWASLDLVAPCPPGAMCVWAGVVPAQGTWTADGGGIVLAETGENPGPARPRPTRLDPDGEALRSTEPDGSCPYTRAPTTPAPP